MKRRIEITMRDGTRLSTFDVEITAFEATDFTRRMENWVIQLAASHSSVAYIRSFDVPDQTQEHQTPNQEQA